MKTERGELKPDWSFHHIPDDAGPGSVWLGSVGRYNPEAYTGNRKSRRAQRAKARASERLITDLDRL